MTSILFLLETIYCNQFRWIYLKNKNLFLVFFCVFQSYIKFSTFSKKDDPHSLCVSEINDSGLVG